MHFQPLDEAALRNPEMHQRLVRGHESLSGSQHPGNGQIAQMGRDLGADAPTVAGTADQSDQQGVARRSPVAVDGQSFAEIGDHQIQIAVPIEIGQGRSVTHRVTVQSPSFANRFES